MTRAMSFFCVFLLMQPVEARANMVRKIGNVAAYVLPFSGYVALGGGTSALLWSLVGMLYVGGSISEDKVTLKRVLIYGGAGTAGLSSLVMVGTLLAELGVNSIRLKVNPQAFAYDPPSRLFVDLFLFVALGAFLLNSTAGMLGYSLDTSQKMGFKEHQDFVFGSIGLSVLGLIYSCIALSCAQCLKRTSDHRVHARV